MRATKPRASKVHRHGRGTRGQSLVELAIVAPVLLVLVCGIIEFGMALKSYISLTSATREGARFASAGNQPGAYPLNCDGVTETTAVGKLCASMDGLDTADLTAVSVTYPSGNSRGNKVKVQADYTYNFVTPIGDMLTFFTGGAFPDFLGLSTDTSMRIE
jgi:Flp pilus assembly protein TadG